jgi:hypothetical protein
MSSVQYLLPRFSINDFRGWQIRNESSDLQSFDERFLRFFMCTAVHGQVAHPFQTIPGDQIHYPAEVGA